jgi:hypothetical protein
MVPGVPLVHSDSPLLESVPLIHRSTSALVDVLSSHSAASLYVTPLRGHFEPKGVRPGHIREDHGSTSITQLE